jgi:hypothetical protein
MTSTVRIDWIRKYDNNTMWNEVCAWAIERFGLPGDRFETHANVDYMEFIFKSNKDALLMAIQWNARIVPNNDLAVETMGRFIQ